MRNYFIDLENVRSAGLEGVHSLDEDDNVYVFYSDNANTLTIPTLESISSSKANVQYIKINCYGSNAMDFQIVAMFGAIIEREKRGAFYIISHDHGFKAAVSFCKAFFEDLNLTMGAYVSIQATLDPNAGKEEDDTKVEVTVQRARTQPRRRGGKTLSARRPQKADAAKAASPAVNAEGKSYPKEYAYIYNVFGELLSEQTINIYAEAIHEGVRSSKNKDEVKKFFESRFGDKESEALYKLVQSEFARLKSMSR